jgi:predicted GH43/DUF377 family glycosyl hydrolase
MRRYVLGASLLKLDDPAVEIGRLKEPLLIPNSDEREGLRAQRIVFVRGTHP